MKQTYRLVHGEARKRARERLETAQDGEIVTFSEPTRNLDQNAAQWPILDAFSKQLKWPVNGHFVKMTPEEWKDVLTAAFTQETTRLASGLDGGVVMLGLRTSNLGKKVFSEWLDFLKATAALRGVDIETWEMRK